ncbi:hypothetical protein, partial [Acinetobacter pittii]
MKTFKMVRLLTCGLFSLLMCSVATAKTEKITLKQNIGFGEEAVIFNTTKGEVILNMYALPERVAKQIKPFKKGEFKHEVRQFEKSYDNQQAEQISL